MCWLHTNLRNVYFVTVPALMDDHHLMSGRRKSSKWCPSYSTFVYTQDVYFFIRWVVYILYNYLDESVLGHSLPLIVLLFSSSLNPISYFLDAPSFPKVITSLPIEYRQVLKVVMLVASNINFIFTVSGLFNQSYIRSIIVLCMRI